MKWTEAAKTAPYSMPARLSFGAFLICGVNWAIKGNSSMSAGSLDWHLSDLVLLFLVTTITFFPVSYVSAARTHRGATPLSTKQRCAYLLVSLVIGLIVAFAIKQVIA